jgi:hypothetical protein
MSREPVRFGARRIPLGRDQLCRADRRSGAPSAYLTRACQLLKLWHMTVICDGLLVEYGEGIGECDLGEACQALESRDDYPAYRTAHGRVVDGGQSENEDEYGGEA